MPPSRGRQKAQRITARRAAWTDDCLGKAAQLSYAFLFALFPFVLFLTTLLGYLPLPNLMEEILALLAAVLLFTLGLPLLLLGAMGLLVFGSPA